MYTFHLLVVSKARANPGLFGDKGPGVFNAALGDGVDEREADSGTDEEEGVDARDADKAIDEGETELEGADDTEAVWLTGARDEDTPEEDDEGEAGALDGSEEREAEALLEGEAALEGDDEGKAGALDGSGEREAEALLEGEAALEGEDVGRAAPVGAGAGTSGAHCDPKSTWALVAADT